MSVAEGRRKVGGLCKILRNARLCNFHNRFYVSANGSFFFHRVYANLCGFFFSFNSADNAIDFFAQFDCLCMLDIDQIITIVVLCLL